MFGRPEGARPGRTLDIPYDDVLQSFVETGLNVGDRGDDFTTALDMSPAELFEICQNNLTDCQLSDRQTLEEFTRLGFRQTLKFNVTATPAATGTYQFSLSVLQCDKFDDGYQAFKQHVETYQNWKMVLTPFPGLGNYAFQTTHSIFWTRWSTLFLFDLEPNDETSETARAMMFEKVKTLARRLDQSSNFQRIETRFAKKANVDKGQVPENVFVGKPAVLKLFFQPKSHFVKNVYIKPADAHLIALGGNITSSGELPFVSLGPGTIAVKIFVAHTSSLRVSSSTFTITMTKGAEGSDDSS